MNLSILELCTSPNLGGLELYVINTIKAFQKYNVRSCLFVRKDSPLYEKAIEEKLPVNTIRKASRYLPLISAWRLSQAIRKAKYNVIHVHWSKDISLAIWTKLFLGGNLRIVYTRQMELPGKKKDFYHNFIYRNIDLLITITDRLRNQVLQNTVLPQDRVVRLYHGVDKLEGVNRQACQEFRSKNSIDKDAFIVGLVGRIEEYKGQHILVGAIEHLAKKDVNVHGVIMGGAMDEAYLCNLKQRVEAGAAKDKITFLGFNPNPERIMACFDTLVLTTRQETFGLVLIEAMSAGIPVIGTNAGGVPEIIEDNISGLLFPADDARALADRIQNYINNPELRMRCINNALKEISEKFSRERHDSELVTLFKQKIV